MNPDLITADAVRTALRAVRYAKSLRSNQLLELGILGDRLRAQGRADTTRARASELPQLLNDTVWSELQRRRGRTETRHPPAVSTDRELGLLRLDFDAGDIGREAWSMLHFRFFAEARHPVRSAAEVVGVPERTLQRRVARGCQALAEALKVTERNSMGLRVRYRAVTLLFTDIEGQARTWCRKSEARSHALARYGDIMHSAVETRAGNVFYSVNNAVFCEFGDPVAALKAAVAAHRSLAAEEWSACGRGANPLPARTVVHHGRVGLRGRSPFGPELDRAACLLQVGHGGQVLMSSAAEQVLRDHVPAGVRLLDWGELQLHDLRRTECIWQVVAPGLPCVAPAPDVLDRDAPQRPRLAYSRHAIG